MQKSPVIEILDALDEGTICSRLGVKPRSIRLARERRVFPAKWYRVMKDICAEVGVSCPDEVFNFASPMSRPSEGASVTPDNSCLSSTDMDGAAQ